MRRRALVATHLAYLFRCLSQTTRQRAGVLVEARIVGLRAVLFRVSLHPAYIQRLPTYSRTFRTEGRGRKSGVRSIVLRGRESVETRS